MDVMLEFAKGVLRICGSASFRAGARVGESEVACPPLKKLGMDAFADGFTAKELHTRLVRSKRLPAEAFEPDQSRIAGIVEYLFEWKCFGVQAIEPVASSKFPGQAGNRRNFIQKRLVYVLRRALECCDDPAPTFRDPKWVFQGLEEILRAYQREDLLRRRCGRLIVAFRAGRAIDAITASAARNRRGSWKYNFNSGTTGG